MKIVLAMLAMCSGLLVVPFCIIAEAAPALNATMMCRDATSGEKPSAMMGSTGIVCKSMPRLPISKMGPNTAGMSGAAATAAWRSWLSQAMSVPEVLGGGAGG